MEKVNVKVTGNEYMLIDFDVVKKILRDLFLKTEEIYIDMAIMTAKSHFKNDKPFIENVFFIAKLLQLEASGKVRPPINFGTLYNSIVNDNRLSTNDSQD